jgi:hypothetical protein
MARLTHAEFAANVLAASASPKRIGKVISHILGDRIEIGPLRVGPGGVGSATAIGVPGLVEAYRCNDLEWDIALAVPVHLSVRVNLAGAIARYTIAVRVQTRIRLVPEEPCTVVVDIEQVHRDNIAARVNPRGMPSRLVGKVGNIDVVVADHVLAYINELFASPPIVALRRIDVAQMMERAWDAGLVVDMSVSRSLLEPARRIAHTSTHSTG